MSAQRVVLFRDLRLGAVFELLALFVDSTIVGLARGVMDAFIVDSQDTIGRSVLIFVMVVRVLLSMTLEFLGPVFTLSTLVVFGDRVHRLIRGVHLRVELGLLRVVEGVVAVVDHRLRGEYLP